ncbi:PREDICTED: olfactory receptor 7A17-like [Galeopterus variegatus]|uniref:Olfactory receptor 7A17-like n=1 Tax=Galeopterus variegatus TaxID=482537 RepID=A0ABM0PZY2_GALVR|nr:PREDICTED: olfactory receptor 7A17-like [Galeopterus variegatus]
MELENDTQISTYLLMRFSEEPRFQPFLFGLFLFLYLVTMLGNLTIILAIISDSHFHTPVYFFLSNLPFSDICVVSTTVHKMLLIIQTQSKAITCKGWITQIFFVIFFVILDNILLAVKAYDSLVAICHPFHYTVSMNTLCVLLVPVSWILSALNSLLQSLMVLQLSFCTDLEIPDIFYELYHMVNWVCSEV